MLCEIRRRLGTDSYSYSLMTELCIQTAYDKIINGDCFDGDINPTQRKLDEILSLLKELLPEV